jgi:hypothetical protein
MTPFNTLNVQRPLHPKNAIGNIGEEVEKVPFRKLIIEASIAAVATVIIQELITRYFVKKAETKKTKK